MPRVASRWLLVCATALAASPALASEPTPLEELNRGQVGSASLVALDAASEGEGVDGEAHDIEGATYGVLTAEASGGRRYAAGGWAPVQPAVGVGFEIGAYASRWSALDLRTTGWLYPPGLVPEVGGSSRTDLQAAADLPLGGLSVDLVVDGRLALSSDADRGVRRYDVAPVPYVDAALDPVLWIAARHREADDDESIGLALDYGVRATRYFADGPLGGRTSHRVGLGMGIRDWAEVRGAMRWLNLAYARHEVADDPARHQLDATGFSGAIDFGRSTAGPHGFNRAHVGFDAGWSFLWSPASDRGYVHTPRARLAIDYRDVEVGRYGGAVHHRAELAPAGTMVAITSFEAVARMESDEVPVALALLGDFARVEPLPHGSTADVWYVRGDAELYAHLEHVDVGAEGSLGHGLPTGSMGWSPTPMEPRFWGRAGAFFRVHAPF